MSYELNSKQTRSLFWHRRWEIVYRVAQDFHFLMLCRILLYGRITLYLKLSGFMVQNSAEYVMKSLSVLLWAFHRGVYCIIWSVSFLEPHLVFLKRNGSINFQLVTAISMMQNCQQHIVVYTYIKICMQIQTIDRLTIGKNFTWMHHRKNGQVCKSRLP